MTYLLLLSESSGRRSGEQVARLERAREVKRVVSLLLVEESRLGCRMMA